ncbi:MAG: 16S rRNA (cytidine(1402)-2'-O)-methyltransferase [Xenococcaceae cyanobacterium MO_167.B52]|nr:16S rRNA (cytidine(1402)-2'-O)-methyltransferase [Xenococcaceae cyanobacterium MO_167.B52]
MAKTGTLGKLYLVGTPIGNLEDMTPRGVRILQQVDLIAAEDTRHTGRLLQYFEITTPQISYHEHNKQSRTIELVQKLEEGMNLALVSDAGMPSISDPGQELVVAAIAAKVEVITIPGVSASLTALTASGMISDRFVFEGFLPTKQSLRQERLESLKHETRTIIFYEAPHRLLSTLQDLSVVMGQERGIVLGRELTKIHEEFWRGNLEDAIALYQGNRQPKGEYTLVLAGATTESLITSETEIKQELAQLLEQGMTRSQASRHLAKLTSLSRREIYQLALDIDISE